MLTLQVLPTRTFSVKLAVFSFTEPDNTSNAAIWSRAGGARFAIGAVLTLLSVGQPFGPGAALPWVPSVAAIAMAATITSPSAATEPTTRDLTIGACRREYQGNRSIPNPLSRRLAAVHRRSWTARMEASSPTRDEAPPTHAKPVSAPNGCHRSSVPI